MDSGESKSVNKTTYWFRLNLQNGLRVYVKSEGLNVLQGMACAFDKAQKKGIDLDKVNKVYTVIGPRGSGEKIIIT